MEKFYAGVGSRRAPNDILTLIAEISHLLHEYGWILRTGDAVGCDKAFRDASPDHKQVFTVAHSDSDSMAIAEKYHGAWDKLNSYGEKLHARNAKQILGKDLKTPVDFMVCWTKDGCNSHKARSITTGGTGTAISIADAHRIRIFNLARKEDRKFWENILSDPDPSFPEKLWLDTPPDKPSTSKPQTKQKLTRTQVTAAALRAGYSLQKNGSRQISTSCPIQTCKSKLVAYVKIVADGIHAVYACTCGARSPQLIACSLSSRPADTKQIS